MKMKLTFNKVFFFLFLVLWVLLIVWNIVTPYKKYSENENRYLTKMPKFSYETLVNGKYMNKLDEYVNDQFIMRDEFISAQSMMEYGIGKRENNGVFIADKALIKHLDEPNMEYVNENIEGINYFADKFKGKSSVMLVPSASQIQSEKLPRFAQTWDQEKLTNDSYNLLNKTDNISLYETLNNHDKEYIYYRTDHHWTTYGAYLAYVEYCNTLGLTPSGYNKKTVTEDFNGTLYSSSGVRFMQSDSIEAFENSTKVRCSVFDGKEETKHDFIYFDEFLNQKDKYAYFLGTNQPIVRLYGENNTGKKLVIFKDSYAHCLAPMLLEQFDEVALVDLRYINKSLDTMLDIDEYDNALFLYSVETFTSQKNLSVLKVLLK